MARSYRRIRPLSDPPLSSAAPDFRGFEALAWLTLAVAFLVFCGLGAASYVTFARILPSLTDQQAAALSATVGTVEALDHTTGRWVLASSSQPLQEGDAIRTHEGSRAFVTFFDLSTATIYPLSEVHILKLRKNHFGKPFNGDPSDTIELREDSGRAQIGVAHLNPLSRLDFRVSAAATNGASASLEEGSFIVKSSASGAFQVQATRGTGLVEGAGRTVTIRGGERTQVQRGAGPAAPILAAEDIIDNGSFTQRDGSGKFARWDPVAVAPELQDVAGRVAAATDGPLPVVRFTRTGSTYHGEDQIRQLVNQDVTDYNVVRLELRFKVFGQSVSGGGEQGSEYPLMIRVNYLDESGGNTAFVRGFYIQNDQRMPTVNGQQVPANEWVTLAGEKGIQLQSLAQRPQFIQSIEVGASGHDYDSEIQMIGLIVE